MERLILFVMFKKVFTEYLAISQSPRTKEGFRNPLVIDQYSGQDFMLNEYGWLASDISLLVKSESIQLRDSLMSRLQVLKASTGSNDYRSMIDQLIPRYCQSYAEREAFMKYVNEQHPDWFDDIDREKLDKNESLQDPEPTTE